MNQPLKHRNVSFREGKNKNANMTKFIYSEKATKFCEISTLLLSYVVPVKNKAKISQTFVAFSENMNFTKHFQSIRKAFNNHEEAGENSNPECKHTRNA